jgi:hypothetical protein
MVVRHETEFFFKGVQTGIAGDKIEIRFQVPDDLRKRRRDVLKRA